MPRLALTGEHARLASDKAHTKFTIDAPCVQKHVGDLAKNADLSKFIL